MNSKTQQARVAGDPPQTSMVSVRQLRKVFRDFWGRPKVAAVDGIDFDIQPGEIFGLLGPNGSGKSTTIKILLGLLHATSGAVTVLGKPPSSVDAKRRIGYLPEETYLYPYLTARETLDFFAKLFDFDSATRRARASQLLDMVGLSGAGGRRVGEFSKGMARRVGLSQALVNNPKLIVLDEPTSGLDPIGCRQVKDLMLTLAAQGKTIILSSHLLADVEDVCDRIAILYNGRIRAHGPVKRLLSASDQCRFTTPALPPDALQSVLAAIRAILGNEPQVDRPTLNLEQFFLDVVREAHGEDGQASGASQSGSLATFLRREEG